MIMQNCGVMHLILQATDMKDGRKCVVEEGQKKSAIAKVKVIYPGTGKITINGQEFHKYFRFIEDRYGLVMM